MSNKIYLLILPAILLLVQFAVAESICGNHICEAGETIDVATFCPIDCDYCIDTDSGDDTFRKGIVTYNWNEKMEDVCTKDTETGRSRDDLINNLGEAFCANERGPNTGGAGAKSITCEFGCENGACLRNKSYYSTCVDTDSGKNTSVQGTTKYEEIESRDVCMDLTRGSVRECSGKDCKLYEYYCNEGNQGLTPYQEITYDSITCPVGCRDGACISCEGCALNEQCIKYGTIVEDKYCAQSGDFKFVKELGEDCMQNFECENNNCFENKCLPVCADGCVDKSFKCLPFGSIIGNEYCEDDNLLTIQKEDNSACENNYECEHGICENNICKSPKFFANMKNWFKRIFS